MKEKDDKKDAQKWRMFSQVHDTIGVYPAAVEGGDKPYEKRSDYMNGWNDCGMALMHAYYVIEETYNSLNATVRESIEKLVASGVLYWSYDSGSRKAFLGVLISDTFHYACADMEEIQFDEVPELCRLYEKFGYDGVTAWVANKRKAEPIKERNTEKYRTALQEIKEAS